MKYSILLLFSFLFSCASEDHKNLRQQPDSIRMADSLRLVDSLTRAGKTSMEKAKTDSMNSLASCPELKNYMAMSHHISDLADSDENAEVLRKKFKRLSDSLIVMETEIFSKTYKNLDPSCQELFLDRMKQNATEISEGFNQKAKGE